MKKKSKEQLRVEKYFEENNVVQNQRNPLASCLVFRHWSWGVHSVHSL